MPPKDAAQPLRDGITSVDDLVLLRTTVEKWAQVASDAVYRFKRDDGSFRKDSKSALSGEAPHITTSARAYIALLYADRLRDTSKGKRLPDWHEDFTKLVQRVTLGRQGRRFYEALKKRNSGEKIDPYEVNTFDIAHLADFFQVSAYLQRFYENSTDVNKFFSSKQAPKSFRFETEDEASPLHESCKSADEYNEMAPHNVIEWRLREAIREAAKPSDVGVGFPGEVRFEEGRAESRHYFATLHALRALHALGAKDIDGLASVVIGARSFAIEQSYYFQRGVTHRQDPVRLAFAGCIYAIYDEHVDKDLCLAIVEALAAGQQENGSWPATHPVFRKKSTPWHIASHEVALCLSWLYFQPRVPDTARPLIVGMMRKYLLNGVIPTFVSDTSGNDGSKLDGWQDDHTVSPNTTLGWATAIVCHFLAGFANVLNDWINRRIIEELELQLATERYLIDDTASSPSTRWARDKDNPWVWPDLPPHGWLKDTPLPSDEKARIESKWTDPSVGAAISQSLAEKVLAYIHKNPSEQPRSDRCAGLMPGDPGTRKTSLVKQVSCVLRWPMVAVPASSVFEDGFDKMEARANRVFGLLNHLRGCVIFFDEFEEFFLSRGEDDRVSPEPGAVATTSADPRKIDNRNEGKTGDSDHSDGKVDGRINSPNSRASEQYKSRTIAAFTTSAMLPRLQDLHDKDRCLIFLATNYPEKIDDAIKRAGRFDFTITVKHPTIERLDKYLLNLNEKTLQSTNLEDFTKKDVKNLVDAVREAIEEYALSTNEDSIKFSVVEEILRQVRPIKQMSKNTLKGQAAEVLRRQMDASKAGNPPELVQL
ncbi:MULTISPECIES: AAA family ATPase [unclassified Mesorhizobium]|uniref:AAA family ATPase n=1 Tax=unclassified Mesorhizobium TaxID=325217 RepID=UPI00333B3163